MRRARDFLRKHKSGIIYTTSLVLVVLLIHVTVGYVRKNDVLELPPISPFAVVLGLLSMWGFINTIFILDRLDSHFLGFNELMREMINELDRMGSENKVEVARRELLITISFTPAFGNISSPELYSEGKSSDVNRLPDKPLFLHKLTRVLVNHVNVTMICYNEEKRDIFHEEMAKLQFPNDEEKKKEMKMLWESQAKKIINQVNENGGTVIEVNDLPPTLMFLTNKVALQYTMKANEYYKRNEVIVTKVCDPKTIRFLCEAIFSWKKSFQECVSV